MDRQYLRNGAQGTAGTDGNNACLSVNGAQDATMAEMAGSAAGNGMPPRVCTSLAVRPDNTPKEKVQTGGDIRVVPVFVESILAQDLPDEAKAVEPAGDLEKMIVAGNRMEVPAVQNMANIVGALDNRLYALVRENDQGMRSVEYCQRYGNGRFSPKMRIEQKDILESRDCGRGNRSDLKKKIKIMETAKHDYYNKFSGDISEVLDITDIFDTLAATLGALPVRADRDKYGMFEFYERVIEAVECSLSHLWGHHKYYYPLTEDEIMRVSKGMGMKKDDLVDSLRDYGLLYIVRSSTRNKTNVRLKYMDGSSYTQWRYCIWKRDYLMGTVPPECLVDF